MAKTFTVRVTVPDNYFEDADSPVVEELIAAAVANAIGEQLADRWDDDEYDASIDSTTWGV